MLHVTHQREWDIAASPFGQELVRLGIAHRFLISPISLRYKTKLELFGRIYPTLIWNTLRLGLQSLLSSRPTPKAVLMANDIEALIFGLIRTIFRRKSVLVLQTLIITPRKSTSANALHMLYWRSIIGCIDFGICHARAEVETYARLFPRARGKFVYVPFGTTIFPEPTPIRAKPEGLPLVVTAGRSARDYPLLAKAIRGLPLKLAIICDVAAPLSGVDPSDQIEVLSGCFDGEYLQMLASAAFVVVPVARDDISAGQMVYLHAAALGRAVIMTETSTTVDYATDGQDALLVPRGDLDALKAAISRLLADPALACRLGSAARRRFQADHTTEAYVRNVVAVVNNSAGIHL